MEQNSKISKEDFLQALEQIEYSNGNTPDLTPISGQIFFGSNFKELSGHPPNDQPMKNGSIRSQPNTPLSPNLQAATTTSSNGGKFYPIIIRLPKVLNLIRFKINTC